MTQDSAIAHEEIEKLAEWNHLRPAVVVTSGLPGERLKELYDSQNAAVGFKKNSDRAFSVGVAALPAAIAGLSYIFAGVSGVMAAAPAALSVQAFSVAAYLAAVIGYAVKNRHEPDVKKEIRIAADSRLASLTPSAP